jgi:hypothetical protein
MLSYQEYLSTPFIRNNPKFKDNNGVFKEDLFKSYYTQKLEDYQQFQEDTDTFDYFEYSPFDTSAKPDSRIKDTGFQLSITLNPDRISTGISGINAQTGSGFSRRELAQQSNVIDSTTGQDLGYSPNDVALFSNPLGFIKELGSDPLVLATWEEEGDHYDPITNSTYHHYKGDYKLNADGEYYYETLGDRSPIGKEFLSMSDIITVDGQGLNKYDFFDSDGLDKSVTGTVFKMLFTAAPMLIAGPVSTIYSGALAAREILKSLPMLYGMVTSLFGNEEDSQFLNTLAAYGEKFTGGVTDYAQQNLVSVENFGNLLADVVTQFGQQAIFPKLIHKARGSDKILKKAWDDAADFYSTEMARMGESSLYGIGEDWTKTALGKAAISKFVEPAKKIV